MYSATASDHGGGLDGNGGHNNRKTGEYHCHREPYLSTHQQVQSATKEATRSSYSTPMTELTGVVGLMKTATARIPVRKY